LLNHGDMAGAEREAELALAIARDCGQIVLITAALCTTFAVTAAAQGRWAVMDFWSTDALDVDKYGQIARNWRLHYQYLQARARWHSGNIEGLRGAYEDSLRPNPFEAPAARPYRHLIRGMLRMAERNYAQAEDAFREALREEDGFKVTRAISSARVMLAHALMVRGQAGEAMEVFGPYLEEAETVNSTGWLTRENPVIIPLLRHAHERKIRRAYVEQVLELLGAPIDAVEASGREALSGRELEVLRILAEGLGNREIAERIFVSEATVKTHVQRIMRKLDADSRTQAVARARELMLL
jgi:DNA-binding CsgD family transcriptional regulator